MGSPLSAAKNREWHRLTEYYTPDGTLGRILFTVLGGGVSLTSVAGGLIMLTGPSVGLLELLFGVLFTFGGIAGIFLSLAVLWPVYMSILGNIEDPADYGISTEVVGRSKGLIEEDLDDSIGVLKMRYAEGEISQEEFERRLNDIVDMPDQQLGSRSDREKVRER